MFIALIAATATVAEGIVIDNKGIETVRSYKHPFELKPGTKTSQTYFRAKVPSGLGMPIPVKINYGCFLPNTNSPAPKLEVMYLHILSDNSKVYNSYNLQKVDKKEYGFRCSTTGNVAEFALSREGGLYDARGTITTTAFRPMYDMKPQWKKVGESWETSLPLVRPVEIVVGANIKFKVGNTESYIPSILTFRRGPNVIYQREGAKHSVVIRVAPEATGETSRIFLGVKPRQDMGNSMKAEFKAIAYPPFVNPTWQ